MAVELTLLPLAMIIVFLRLYVRIGWLKKSWWDDYLMVAAMVRTESRDYRVAMPTNTGLLYRNNSAGDHGHTDVRLG